jgi:putative protein-disulfide isomerase
MKLIYIADPMCSWCYGFGKELSALVGRHPDLPLEIVAGGLRPGGTEKLDDNGKQFRLAHWARVEAASGLPFNREGFLARQNFVYDTEPICRAFVAARILAPNADLLSVFRALQRGFYIDALDTTDGATLSLLAAQALGAVGHPMEASTFHQAWLSAAVVAATQADFARTRAFRVQSFPTLLLERNGRVTPVGGGYANVVELEKILQPLMQ